MPATAPLRHLKECRQRKCNTGEIPHATLRKSICIFEEKVLAKNMQGKSFVAEAIRQFDIRLKYVPLNKEQIVQLQDAMENQNLYCSHNTNIHNQ